MGKKHSFLGFLSTVYFMFATANVFAAGYTCPSLQQYTSCETGYFMTDIDSLADCLLGSQDGCAWNGTPEPENKCIQCDQGIDNPTYCPGGTEAPVYTISVIDDTLSGTKRNLGYYSASAGYCTNANDCKTNGASITSVFDTPSVSSRAGYTFQGYYTNALNGTQMVTANGIIGNTSSASGLSGHQTWYAHWKPNKITVKLDKNNDGTPESTIYLSYGTGWYNNTTLTERINSITLPTSDTQICTGYNYNDTQIIDDTGTFTNTTFVTEGTVTLYATWIDKPKVTCPAGQYYSGTGATCLTCPINSYCVGGTFNQDEGQGGIAECPGSGITSGTGNTSAKSCYLSDANCTNVVTNALTATGTCYYSADTETTTAGYTACDASACNVTECANNYIISTSGHECIMNPDACPANYYCDDSGQHACPESHPESTPGSTSIDDCFVRETEQCKCEQVCPDKGVTVNSCVFKTEYFYGVRYYGNDACVLEATRQPLACSLTSIRCKGDHYFRGELNQPTYSTTGDWSCESCKTLEGGYNYSVASLSKNGFNATSSEGAHACYKNAELACTPPICPTEISGTCSYDSTAVGNYAGWEYYDDPKVYPSSKQNYFMCPDLEWSCFVGYDKHEGLDLDPSDCNAERPNCTTKSGTCIPCAATPEELCTPHVYTISLVNNIDLGDETVNNSIYQKYLTGIFADQDATNEITSIEPPSRAYWTFNGYFTAPNALYNAVQIIDAQGNLVPNTSLAYAEYTEDTPLYAWWTRNMTNCQIGMFYTGTDEIHGVCEKDTYCPGTGRTNIGTPGCFTSCPKGGFTDTTGKTIVTDCYKIFNEGDLDDNGTEFNIPNGTGTQKCYFVGNEYTGKYVSCTTNITSCDAGYYVSPDAPGRCTPVNSGQYSPENDMQIYDCAPNGTYQLGSHMPRGTQADCYTICDTVIPSVQNSTSVVVSPGSEIQDYSPEGTYNSCLYDVECITGYDNTNGENPTCTAHEYTITLDKNGGQGTTPESINCVFDSATCQLPATNTLTKQGYIPVAQWCTRTDGTGTCYEAGTNIEQNISADASNVTLYAQWTPNVFMVELSTPAVNGLTPTNNKQGPVYLKYETGWYTSPDATTKLNNITDLGTQLPELTGYIFGGYELNGITIVDAAGVLQVSALTAVSSDNQVATAIWGEGTIICQPGTYYPGTGNECVACTKNWYCDKETTVTTNSGEAGRTQCPQNGTTQNTGTDNITMCNKDGLEYMTTLDNGMPRTKGTQTCYFDTMGYTNCTYPGYEDSIEVNWCAGGYWYESGIDCITVGADYFSPASDMTKTACPDSGHTNGATTSDSITDCIKQMTYESATKNAGGKCNRYANENGIYNSACINDTIIIEWCAGGYWYDPTQSTTDCIAVGENHYSPKMDMAKYPCPSNGTTSITTAETPVNTCSRSVPYPGAQYEGPAVNGLGTQSCYYAGDNLAEYDDGYINNCGTIVINQCDTGYYWTQTENPASTDKVCVPVSIGYYGPVATANSTSMTSRTQCETDAETGVRGTTKTETSGQASECYVENKSCSIGAATGKTTCNYSSVDKDYTDCDSYVCVLESCPAGTTLNTQSNSCDECQSGHYCTGGDSPAETCVALGDRFTQSMPGASTSDQCYDNCVITDIENATSVSGIIYRDGSNTCAAVTCADTYYLNNGKCEACPAGSYCDPNTNNGQPQTCPQGYTSDAGATNQDMCYQACTTDDVTNSTSVDGRDYYGNGADTCVAVTCADTYYLNNGTCSMCEAGNFCEPGQEPQTCPQGYTSDAGATSQDMCYQACTTDDVINSTSVDGRDYYGNGADTCVAVTCADTYYLNNDKCEACPAGSYCAGGDAPAVSCAAAGDRFTQADNGATNTNQCYDNCQNSDVNNATSVSGIIYRDGSNTCAAVTCAETYYLNNGKCDACPAGSYCAGGDTPAVSCAAAGDRFTQADNGAANTNQCYDNCQNSDVNNATSVSGIIYRDGSNTCAAVTCADTYYLNNGTCSMCEAGNFCEPGQEPQTCPQGYTSDAGATSQDMCYQACTTDDVINSTSVDGRDYYGNGADTCVAVTCADTYYLNNGTCSVCEAGNFCEPGQEPQTCPQGYTSDAGATSQDMCYQACTTDDVTNSTSVDGRDYYGNGADTCIAVTCADTYYLNNGTCSMCEAGNFCEPGQEPQTCPQGYTSDAGATNQDMCYQACTTDDVTNSTSVDGRDYYGNGADTCFAVTCESGYYLNNGTCSMCEAGNFCEPGQAPQSCPPSHPHTDGLATDIYACYTICPAIEFATEIIERDYYDDNAVNACRALKCQDSYYLTGEGLCKSCPDGKYCDTDGIHTCPQTHPLSTSGQNFSIEQCFNTCAAYDLLNGQAIPHKTQVFHPESCEYYGKSNTGNPCDITIVNGKPACIETSCNFNFELIDGICQPCNREHALSYKTNGNCVVETCATGYHPNGQACESDTTTCSAPNAKSAVQTWIPRANAFGECRITECVTGYHLADNTCQLDTESCRLAHGIGTRQWDTKTNTWGTCIVTQCDPGYTNDPSLTDDLKTNEHWVQCGRCNNMYHQGKQAASSYIQECEIGACMYQGELYELQNNECNLICKEYCDETGCRIWNAKSGRCEHRCEGGYTPWSDAHSSTN